MQRKNKKLGIVIGTVVLVLVVGFFVINFIAERKIISAIQALPENISVNYQNVDVNIISGNVSIQSPYLFVKGATTGDTILDANLKSINLKGISFWDYLVNSKISLNDLALDSLDLRYVHDPKIKNSNTNFLKKIKKKINLTNANLLNAKILVTNKETDSLILSLPELNMKVDSVKLNQGSDNDPAFSYANFELNAGRMIYALSDYDNLKIDSINIDNNRVVAKSLRMGTKYSRSESSKIFEKERDHFDASIQQIDVQNAKLNYSPNNRSSLSIEKIKIMNPEVEVYRDKLISDDTSTKSFYSKILRNLNFDLAINEIEISEGNISYEEKAKSEAQPGKISLSDTQIKIEKLGNTYGNSEETKITFNSQFMDTADLTLNWNFVVQDTTDRFVVKVDLGYFKVMQMDQFTKPNLNIDLNGELNQTYFTVSGNPLYSQIDLKVNYEDFEIVILQSDGKEKNKIISGVVNLFVSEDSDQSDNNYRYGHADNVERDVTKSIFNFIWLNARKGLRSAMAGDGERKNK